MKNRFQYAIIIFALVGIFDAGYLTYEHYSNKISPCSTNIFVDCGKVLQSQYATIANIPVAIAGLLFYFLILIFGILLIKKPDVSAYKMILKRLTFMGIFASLYFVYLQGFVLHAVCMYCILSALNTFVLFYLARKI